MPVHGPRIAENDSFRWRCWRERPFAAAIGNAAFPKWRLLAVGKLVGYLITKLRRPAYGAARQTEVAVEIRDTIAVVRLMRPRPSAQRAERRPDGRNRRRVRRTAQVGRCAVLTGSGEHFSAGLDLSEIRERDAVGRGCIIRGAGTASRQSRVWPHSRSSPLHGAVVGGGLELASSCPSGVADDTAFFALPEGSRGIFVGGGGSVRIQKLIGAHRMLDMMLTGRVYKAAEAVPLGLRSITCRRPGTRTSHRAGRTHRHQRADDQLFADARAAASPSSRPTTAI